VISRWLAIQNMLRVFPVAPLMFVSESEREAITSRYKSCSLVGWPLRKCFECSRYYRHIFVGVGEKSGKIQIAISVISLGIQLLLRAVWALPQCFRRSARKIRTYMAISVDRCLVVASLLVVFRVPRRFRRSARAREREREREMIMIITYIAIPVDSCLIINSRDQGTATTFSSECERKMMI
jgi:hypothetical protein